MKVLTNPVDQTVKNAERFDGSVLVARWKKSGSLTSFRYHTYHGAWYCVGDKTKYPAAGILTMCDVLAVFFDEN